MKNCSICKELKPLEEFGKRKETKDGLSYRCKICHNNWKKEYNKKNPEKIDFINKKYYSKSEKKLHKKKKDLENYYNNIDHYKNYKKKYYEENKEKISIKGAEYNSKPETKEKRKKYREKNKEKIRIYRNKYHNHKYKNDLIFRLRNILICSLNRALKRKNNIKSDRTEILLGCTIQKFKQYIEKQFLPEMTWENHGLIWEIDHIKPCSKFDLSIEEQQLECFNYKNCQPLFKTTEIAKSFGYDKLIGNKNKINKWSNK